MSKRKSKPYFEFQQFTIFHDQCAMKVGTDGVLLGSWTNVNNAHSALDIGTGTGLVALMLAQRNLTLSVDAIDIDEQAVRQAAENAKNSPFAGRVGVLQSSIQAYTSVKTYDIIVSNPPYFAETVKSPNMQRNLARNNESLSMDDLLLSATKLIGDKGRISLIYPFACKKELNIIAAKNQLYITRATNVLPTPESEPKRILIELSKEKKKLEENDLLIEIDRHVYSEKFKELVRDFYLKL